MTQGISIETHAEKEVQKALKAKKPAVSIYKAILPPAN